MKYLNRDSIMNVDMINIGDHVALNLGSLDNPMEYDAEVIGINKDKNTAYVYIEALHRKEEISAADILSHRHTPEDWKPLGADLVELEEISPELKIIIDDVTNFAITSYPEVSKADIMLKTQKFGLKDDVVEKVYDKVLEQMKSVDKEITKEYTKKVIDEEPAKEESIPKMPSMKLNEQPKESLEEETKTDETPEPKKKEELSDIIENHPTIPTSAMSWLRSADTDVNTEAEKKEITDAENMDPETEVATEEEKNEIKEAEVEEKKEDNVFEFGDLVEVGRGDDVLVGVYIAPQHGKPGDIDELIFFEQAPIDDCHIIEIPPTDIKKLEDTADKDLLERVEEAYEEYLEKINEHEENFEDKVEDVVEKLEYKKEDNEEYTVKNIEDIFEKQEKASIHFDSISKELQENTDIKNKNTNILNKINIWPIDKKANYSPIEDQDLKTGGVVAKKGCKYLGEIMNRQGSAYMVRFGDNKVICWANELISMKKRG